MLASRRPAASAAGIVAWSVSEHPDLAQQDETSSMPMAAEQEDASPVLHSDMGRQHQHAACVEALDRNGFTQSASRKGSCIGNGTAEQVFGRLNDEFYRDRDRETFEEFKADLEAYIQH